ncbi:MAG: hypothetical protein ABIG11_01005 [bacterium]
MLTADAEKDARIPGEDFSFWQLEMAQALGDFQALEAAGRKIIRFHLRKPLAESMARLEELAAMAVIK